MEKRGKRKINQNEKMKLKEERGITLLVLVITIIIIIILATITMNLALGDGGLLGQAEDIRDIAENSTQTEAEKRNNLAGQLADMIPFEPQETPEPETGGQEFNMKDGVIEIKWLQGTTNYVSDVPNEPKVKEISNGTMELVKYVEGGTTEQERWVPGTDYEYVAGTGTGDNNQSRWANARVTIDGVDSYFVWIPRYAYRIVYFKDEPSKNEYKNGTITEEQAIADGKIVGYSDSRGIVTAEGKRVDSITSSSNTTHTMVSKDYFMPHPAFLDGTDNGFENGEWDEDLEGLWIGKYEASKSNATSSSMGSGTILKVQPGVRSYINIKIGDLYTYSQNYSTELESHMLKNSEWGAVAYLTESAYGRNGTEITQNTSSSHITGSAEGSDGNTNTDYTSTDGQKASSTGNVYGIYDLSGGTVDYVAGYYNGSDANATYIGYGSSFASIGGDSTKFATTYNSSGSSKLSAEQNYKYGDATYETRNWHLDRDSFVNADNPYVVRGGTYDDTTANAGILNYYSRLAATDTADSVLPYQDNLSSVI